MTDSDNAIVVEGLQKSFGDVHALRGIDFSVPRGTVLGMLGPNGAGKTTTVRVLTTLLHPDAGRAVIEGFDVVRDAAAVRRCIGLAGQATAIQIELTGRENLEIVGRLYHLPKEHVRRRATELLDRFELADAADRPAKTYSGGMQRRLDLAASLIAEPSVMFLDEPTIGLDPHGRLGIWDTIRELVSRGTTLLLTTQYLEEADELADAIIVIDRGLVIASGTSDDLKDKVGGDVLEFVVHDRARVQEALGAVAHLSEVAPHVDDTTGRVTVSVGSRGSQSLVEAVRRLDALHIEPDALALRRPSLDDVFLAVTGHFAEEETNGAKPAGRGRRRRGQ
ncbi:MAG TPA: ATP-binding cassette domain-containing protein [Candidatus Dormibacteraeota bacterium]|nr:ATP-binding cassette domain-containing protein [Candidatus Dormibacteraeota bacterium]